MYRLNNPKRLMLGLGIMVIGWCAALPFRRHETANAVTPSTPEDAWVLGQDVALQVPGQTAAADFPRSSDRMRPTDDEPSEQTVVTAPEPELEQTTPPPLPDRYRPLFKPSGPEPAATGGVISPPAGPVGPVKRLRRHTIHDGDSLEGLATRYLGDPSRASEILAANRQILKDPDLLPIGAEIVIPRRRATPRPAPVSSSSVDDQQTLVPLPTDLFRRGQ